jgi:hypothetical protein
MLASRSCITTSLGSEIFEAVLAMSVSFLASSPLFLYTMLRAPVREMDYAFFSPGGVKKTIMRKVVESEVERCRE